LRQTTTPTPQPTIEFTLFMVPSSSKLSSSKFEKNKQKNSTMVCQARSMLSPERKKLIFTPIEQAYTQKLERITTWVRMGDYEKQWASKVLELQI
jgi:hypothetical protein